MDAAPRRLPVQRGTRRAELTDIWAVLTNSTNLVAYPHTITAAILIAGVFLVAVSSWHLRKRNEVPIFRASMILGTWVVVIGGVGGVSPSVPAGWVWTSLIALVVVYALLAVVEIFLLLRYIKAGPPE